MNPFGLVLGIIVMVVGIVDLYMGMSGKWVYLKKKADDESAEDIKEKKVQQTQRRYRVFGIILIVLGIVSVLLSTVWVH